jgi:hypothetical protein
MKNKILLVIILTLAILLSACSTTNETVSETVLTSNTQLTKMSDTELLNKLNEAYDKFSYSRFVEYSNFYANVVSMYELELIRRQK